MKKLPTALTVPSSSLKVWLTIAPPLDAIAPALGRFACGASSALAPVSHRWRLRCGVAEIEEAGIDAVSLKEGLDVDESAT